MTNPNLKAQYLIEAIKNFNRKSTLPITFAIVDEVTQEGYYVNVIHSVKEIGEEVIKDIPVLRNKYINTPILKDDLVILIPLSHLFQNYLEDKRYGTEIQYTQCYFALPMVFKDDFKHKNEYSLLSPKEKYKATLSDDNGFLLETQDGLKIKFNTTDLTFEMQNVTLTNQNKIAVDTSDLSIKAKAPIEIGTQTATLGTILQDLSNAILSLASATAGPTTPASPTLAADVAKILAKISASFK